MASLGSLSVFLTANTSPFQRKMKASSKVIGGLKSGVMALGGVLAGAFAIGKVVRFTGELVTLGDEIGKASKRIGIGAEEYQKLGFAARRAGATANDVERAFKRMSSTIFDAGKGLKESQDALDVLSLSFKELNGLKPDKQFEKIANSLNLVEDETTKAALAQDVFGRAGTALIPLLDNYKQLGSELERIGGIISNENVMAAEDFKDSIEDLTTQFKALATETGILKFLRDVGKEMNNLFRLTKRNSSGRQSKLLAIFEDIKFFKLEDFAPDLTKAELPRILEERAEKARKKAEVASRVRKNQLKEEISIARQAEAVGNKEFERVQQNLVKQEDSFNKRIASLQKELVITKMITEGREREAFVLREIATLGPNLTDAQKKKAGELAGAIFDASQKKETEVRQQAGPRLSAAISAGTQAAFALRTAGFGTDADNKLRIKNTKANIAAAVELRKQNRDGIKVTGIRTVDNVIQG